MGHNDVESGRMQSRNGTSSPTNAATLSPTEKRRIILALYLAAMKGDWERAKEIFETYPNEIQCSTKITTTDETALHVATVAKNVHFVKQLIKRMSDTELALKDAAGNPAFSLAAVSGNMQIATAMLHRQHDLAFTRGTRNMLPIYAAVLKGNTKMVWWLYSQTKAKLESRDRSELFVALVRRDMYDVALNMLEKNKELATARDEYGETALHALAEKSCMPVETYGKAVLWNFFWSSNKDVERTYMHKLALKLAQYIWDEIVLLEDSEISDLIRSPWRLLHKASENGNVELLTILIRSYPRLIYKVDGDNYTIFHVAVMYRHQNIFKLIHEMGSIKDMITPYTDGKGNNILHLAAKLPSARSRTDIVPGPALLLQRELLWFQEVRNMVPPEKVEAQNYNRKTPYAIFLEDHEQLLKEGEKWMRATANSCMVVATLIATVVFAAAFTIPGGKGQDNGIPIFFDKTAFKVYAIMNAMSLICSVSSVLTFLCIMTSRCVLDDFRWSLPNKLIIGLVSLFLSISTMVAAFTASFFLVFNHGNQHQLWFAIVIAVIASLPVIMFIRQHFRLFMDVTKTTYMSKSFFNPNESLFPRRFVDSKNSSEEE